MFHPLWKGIFTINVKEHCFVDTDKNQINPEMCAKTEDQSLHSLLLFPTERVNRKSTLKSSLYSAEFTAKIFNQKALWPAIRSETVEEV